MKRLLSLLALLGIAGLVMACGPQEPLVASSAADINLTAADLGAGYTLVTETGLDDILEQINLAVEDKGAVVDGNRRVLTSVIAVTATQPAADAPPLMQTEVLATVLVYNASGAAQTGLTETREGFVGALAPTLTLSAVAISTVADQVEFWKAEIPDRSARLYLALFRKTNVLGFVAVVGPDSIEETWVLANLQIMVNRVPQATTP